MAQDGGNGSRLGTAISVLGASAGFGALVYAVGLAILWLRYATTGFNADQGVAVASRGAAIALGFRWVVGWAIVIVAATGILNWLIVKVAGGRVARASRGAVRIGVIALVALVVVAAFVTWSALTLAVDLLAIVIFIFWDVLVPRRIRPTARQPYVNTTREPRRPDVTPPDVTPLRRRRPWMTLAFVAALATVSAIGWQLEINLPYVSVRYRVVGQSKQYDGIYFGEQDSLFYIAPRPGGKGPFFRAIAIYPADHIYGLSIQPRAQTTCTRVDRPSVVVEHAITSAWHTIEQHFSRTGQPAPPVLKPRTLPGANEPEGFCPALP
jgi:hypothetical protein